ncbi:hypothetical protein ACB092_08G109900 [Castanea dentata]
MAAFFRFQPTPGLSYMFVLLPFSIAINLTYHNHSELNIINLLNYNLCNFELVQYCHLEFIGAFLLIIT